MMENFTSFTTEFTYKIQRDEHYVDTCQESWEFSLVAVNVVGKGNESTIIVVLNQGI